MGLSGGSLRTTLGAAVKATYPPQGIGDELETIRVSQFANDQPSVLQFGTGSGRFDRLTLSDRSILPGASATWDLYTGTDLLGLAGETCAFRTVRQVKVSIVSGGDTSGVRVGGAASDEWVGFFESAGDSLDIFPDGPPFWVGSPAGKAVGASTKNLKVENLGAAEVVVRVLIAGAISAAGEWMGFGLLTYP
jgi:hypothetical protein